MFGLTVDLVFYCFTFFAYNENVMYSYVCTARYSLVTCIYLYVGYSFHLCWFENSIMIKFTSLLLEDEAQVSTKLCQQSNYSVFLEVEAI